MSESSRDERPVIVHYRVDAAEYEGRVVEVTANSMRVVGLAEGAVSAVPIHRPLMFHLKGGNLTESVPLDAHVTFWRKDPDGEWMLVELAEEDVSTVRDAMRPHRAVRIPVRVADPVRVKAEDLRHEVAFEAALVDVSESGLGIILPGKEDRQVAAAMAAERDGADRWTFVFTFRLPGNRSDYLLIGEVRYRTWTRGCVKYGIQVDSERSAEAFPAQKDTLLGQMLAYQQALLRAA